MERRPRRLAWLTDIHLNFVSPKRFRAFVADVRAAAPDAVAITGDIAEATDVGPHLENLAEAFAPAPICFVLGNHDFYRGSIADVRGVMRRLAGARERLRYLTFGDVVTLAPGVGLVGDDGWGDGRNGDFANGVVLNDFFLIRELRGLEPEELRAKLAALGDESAARLGSVLARALAAHEHVIVATHVPPFAEAAWHEGRMSGEDWLPHMSCRATGEALRRAVALRPDRRITVLCGHTHGAGVFRAAPNILVKTGGAEYGEPCVCEVLEV